MNVIYVIKQIQNYFVHNLKSYQYSSRHSLNCLYVAYNAANVMLGLDGQDKEIALLPYKYYFILQIIL